MRNKRKRYRKKKKLHLKELKFDRQHPYIKNCVDVQKSVKKLPTESPTEYYITDKSIAVIEQKECTLSVNLVTDSCTLIQEENSNQNMWHYLEPDENLSDTDHNWDEEDLKLLNDKIKSQQQAEDLYGEYIDNEPYFPRLDQDPKWDLPAYIERMDKISIRSKLLEMHSKAENAKELARNYRDRCDELKAEIIKMKAQKLQLQAQALEEKQKTRHFWRNEILEGQSRSGRMVRNALKINQ